MLVKNKCCDLTWVAATEGQLPTGALQGGLTPEKEPLFIVRTSHEGAVAVGMMNPSRGCCSIPYGGQELCKSEYEALVVKCIPL